MASLIEGYEYDIFISYRQKDNKYDGWVTDFVNNLKSELEATFKEEVSIYFDINPHDGLLETHDVDASLKEKLKCLVFIPVISRTYCDPKSFAWKHEFKEFIDVAGNDRLGLKVKTPNGNITSRVLPVRIHELNKADIELCESVTGGVLRGIEFVYKSTGVNRPLRATEDRPHDNLNKTYYRDQINKIANAIEEVISGLIILNNIPLSERESNVTESVTSQKDIITDRKGKRSVSDEKTRHRPAIRFPRFKKRWMLPVFILLIPLILSAGFIVNRKIKINWAMSKALPEVEAYYNDGKNYSAFTLLQKAEKYIPDNPEFQRLDTLVSTYLSVRTDPAGVDVFFKEFSDTTGSWKFLGTTPADSLKIARGIFYQFKLVKAGYDTLMAAQLSANEPGELVRNLFRYGTVPAGMVPVAEIVNDTSMCYFIDKYEVTNRQYKKFIDSGAYLKKEYWKFPFIKDNKNLEWEEAMTFMVDQTGRKGPSTWQAGDYPENEDDYPVSGISWYEAAAFAEFAGKELPTLHHWKNAAGFYILFSALIPNCNFSNKKPSGAGTYRSMNNHGTFDMFGNVREWCYNENNDLRITCGGAWNDPTYTYMYQNTLPAFDRSEKNGFRCVKYIDRNKIPAYFFQPLVNIDVQSNDFYHVKPITDDVFQVVKNQFSKSPADLKAEVESRDDRNRDWICEKVSFNSGYDNNRMIVYLFLPKNSNPPYQTIIGIPGADGFGSGSSREFAYKTANDNHYLKDGRAFIMPVYFGTFEREKDTIPGLYDTDFSLFSYVFKDVRRTIDYLETRSDIDINKLAISGSSFGGAMASMVPAVEERLRVLVLVISGLCWEFKRMPEMDQINFVTRVKIPTLILSGRYDPFFSFEYNVKPLYDLLGTLPRDKKLVVYETDHYIPYRELVKETLGWLDKYFGPAKSGESR